MIKILRLFYFVDKLWQKKLRLIIIFQRLKQLSNEYLKEYNYVQDKKKNIIKKNWVNTFIRPKNFFGTKPKRFRNKLN
jgi:hypothetical protein